MVGTLSAVAGTRSRTPVVLLEIANVASGTGNGIVMVVLPWLVLELTGAASERWGVNVIYPVLAALVIIVGAVALASPSIRSLRS
jgi:hypothetical protein